MFKDVLKKISAPQRPPWEENKNLRAPALSAGVESCNPKSNSSFMHSTQHSALMHSIQNSEPRIQNSSNKAFTLLELILIIVITSILAVVVIPNVFSGYSTVKTSVAIKQLADDIRFCQEEATGTRKRCTIEFDTGANSYSVYLDGLLMTNPVTQTSFIVNLDNITLTSVSFSGDTLSFNRYGVPAEGGIIFLNGGSRTISVEAETGSLDIQ